MEYIEDTEAISKYGVIEGLVTNKDIQNAETLEIYGQTLRQFQTDRGLKVDAVAGINTFKELFKK